MPQRRIRGERRDRIIVKLTHGEVERDEGRVTSKQADTTLIHNTSTYTQMTECR
jgi:hypothetical protein